MGEQFACVYWVTTCISMSTSERDSVQYAEFRKMGILDGLKFPGREIAL